MRLQRLRRLLTHNQRFPPGAACHRCGWADVRALVAGSKPFTCYACRRERLGKPRTEGHHVGGRNNPFGRVVDVDANVHRVLSARQDDRPADLRTPIVAPDVTVAWFPIYWGSGVGNEPPPPLPADVGRELDRLTILRWLDEADVAELVDGDRDGADAALATAMLAYWRFRRDAEPGAA
jgi:hypothetical protein